VSRNVVISPPLPWWHAHRRGYVWMLCTDMFCEKPYILEPGAATKEKP
jgi:hypothetical protein